jgi:pimeloyl-ACP methyl ester carboxylesterase
MTISWDILEAGPSRADQTVLFLPGGMCSARSYKEVMAQPALATTRTVAVTLPGHAGTRPLEDFRTETCAQAIAELARELAADVVVGFSMGAVVACEMAVSQDFKGPVVLLGSSLTAADEPVALRALIRLTSVLGTLPAAVLKAGACSMVQKAPVSPERRAELVEDLQRNNVNHLRSLLREYLNWLGRGNGRAERLCSTNLPVWVAHTEKGDGGLTTHERQTLEACTRTTVVRLQGQAFLLPVELPNRVAELTVAALEHARG